MDLDPSPSSAPGADGCGSGDAWPFDTLTTSLLFSSVSNSPTLPPLPANSSSWLTPPSPLWLFDDRQLIPIEAPAAPEAAVAAAVVEEVQRARSGNSDSTSKRVEQINHKWQLHLSLDGDGTDSSSLFKERLTQALRYFKDSTDQHLLVQVWAPVKNGDRYVLTTSGQPFVLDHQSIGLLQYRAVSMMYKVYVESPVTFQDLMPSASFGLLAQPVQRKDVILSYENELPIYSSSHQGASASQPTTEGTENNPQAGEADDQLGYNCIIDDHYSDYNKFRIFSLRN